MRDEFDIVGAQKGLFDPFRAFWQRSPWGLSLAGVNALEKRSKDLVSIMDKGLANFATAS